MKIKIIHTRKNNFWTGHVHLIAWTENLDDTLWHNNILTQQIEFDYYDSCRTSIECFADNNVDTEVDTNSIIFECKKSFKQFVKTLAKSPFKNSRAYDAIDNNCVHSVLFALNAAGININITNEKNIRLKHLVCCFWCPSRIITPSQLMKILQEYQAQNNSVILTKPKIKIE